jgi:hypothetical protein
LHRPFVGDVERHSPSAATELLEGGGEPTLVASDDGDPGAGLLDHDGGRETDAGRTTDHDDFGIFE